MLTQGVSLDGKVNEKRGVLRALVVVVVAVAGVTEVLSTPSVALAESGDRAISSSVGRTTTTATSE